MASLDALTASPTNASPSSALGSQQPSGLFKNLQSFNPEPDTNELWTTGHSVVGLGGARYVVTPKTGATPYRSQVADGRWFELSEPQIFVEMFYASTSSACRR